MSARSANIKEFLARHGLADVRRAPLAGDASVRRYERILADGRSLVLMDAPPAALDLGPFLAIDAWLRARALSAPEVLVADRAAGLALLEDLGDDLFRPLLSSPFDFLVSAAAAGGLIGLLLFTVERWR